MKGKRYSEEQIIRILAEAEAGMKVADVIRKHGIAEGTFYRWKSKYGGLTVNEAKRLKALEDENRRLNLFEDLGEVASISELARKFEADASYVSCIMRLTLLAPDIVVAILQGQEPSGISLSSLIQINSKNIYLRTMLTP